MKFQGHAHRNVDAKGRLMLPPDFRDRILAEEPEGRIVLTLFEKHVIGMSPDQWSETERELNKVKTPSKELQLVKRILFSGYEEVVLDRQGRIQLPTHLRKSGRLDKEVVVFGVDRRFEIWAGPEFEAMLGQDFDVSQELADSGVELPF